MNLAHCHTTKIIPIYTQGRSNEFKSRVTVLKHRMYERENCMWQCMGRGVWGQAPRGNFEKSMQLGAFWRIFMQFISCSESIIYQRQMGKLNFDVMSSTLKSFSKRT